MPRLGDAANPLPAYTDDEAKKRWKLNYRQEAASMSATTRHETLSSQPSRIDRYPKGQAIAGICILVALLLFFNYYPQRFGIWINALDADSYVPVLSPAFFEQYLPWLNLCWVLALGLNIAHLSLGRWTLVTRLLDLGLAFIALNVVVSMIFGPAIFAINTQMSSLDSAAASVAEAMVSAFNLVSPFVLGVIALALVIDLIKKVIDLVRSVSP
jgi:hypothetical protein